MIKDKAKEDLKEIYGDDYELYHDYSAGDLEDIYIVAYLRARADVAKSG